MMTTVQKTKQDAISIALAFDNVKKTKDTFRAYCNKFKEAWGIPDYDPKRHVIDPILFDKDPVVCILKIRNCLRWMNNETPDPHKEEPLGCTRPTEARPDEKPLSYKYRKSMWSALRKLFSENDVDIKDIEWQKLKKFIGRKDLKTRVPYTFKQVQRFFTSDLCFLKYRVCILIYACTGFRLAVLADLNWGHIQPVIFTDGSKFESYRIGPVWSKTDFIVGYTTPETYREINKYRAYREKCGEKITNSSPFIRWEWNRRIKGDARCDEVDPTKSHDGKSIRVSPITLEGHMFKIAYDADLMTDNPDEKLIRDNPDEKTPRPGQHRHLNAIVHSFRGFFYTKATNGGLADELRDLLVGHKTQLERAYYSQFDPDSERKAFEAAWKLRDDFTILPENRAKIKIVKLTKELTKLEGLEKEQQDMKARMDKWESEK